MAIKIVKKFLSSYRLREAASKDVFKKDNFVLPSPNDKLEARWVCVI